MTVLLHLFAEMCIGRVGAFWKKYGLLEAQLRPLNSNIKGVGQMMPLSVLIGQMATGPS